MKKILLFIAVVSLVGCSSTKEIFSQTEESKETYGFLDYSKYAEKDFLMSNGDYYGRNLVIGYLDYTYFPERDCKYEIRQYLDGNERVVDTLLIESKCKPVDYYSLLDSVYKYAISKGANGITNIKYDVNDNKHKIKGILIKRE